MSKIVVESIFNEESFAPINSLLTPSGVAVVNIGTSGATTYGYRITAVNSVGETLASSTVETTSGNASLSSTNFNRITWNLVQGASSYRIYGRTSASELLISSTPGLHFDDTGTITPSGALPGSNTTGYDSSKVCLGSAMAYQSDGSAGLYPVEVARPMEGNVSIPVGVICAVQWSNTIDWIFCADNSAAAATRRIVLYEFNKQTGQLAYKGHIIMTYPPNTVHTIRGIAVGYDVYSTGSVAVTGTAVTGTGTAWSASRLAIGSRIGFGSTDPTRITRWYEISAIGSDTGITLTGAIDSTIAAGAAYCIEDLRIYNANTNTVGTNGGLFVAKGLRPELFTPVGFTIISAVSTDNIRACYWLADAATVTNTTASGLVIEGKSSWTSQAVYVLNGGGTTTARFFKYNVRAALTVATGKDTTSLVLQTGNQATTNNIVAAGSSVLANTSHGPGSGSDSIYFVTTHRVFRAPTSGITAASTTYAADSMVELAPGGTTTYATTTALNSIDYVRDIDRFAVYTTGTGSTRNYLTQYQTSGGQFDMVFSLDTKQTDQTFANPEIAPPCVAVSPANLPYSFTLRNTTYYVKSSAATATNQIYACNFGSDYAFSNISGEEQAIITKSLSCPDNVMFYRVYVNNLRSYGTDRYNHLPAEPYKIWYRTSGISDNSGSWTVVPAGGVLTSVTAASDIQFRIKFKTAGSHGLPTRIFGVSVVYENSLDIPSHLKWNIDDTDNSNGNIGFIQFLYYGSVPSLQIDYYRSDTDVNVLTQTSAGSTNGVFEYWNGSTWVAGLGTDTINIRRRFRPTAALPTGVNLYVRIKVI